MAGKAVADGNLEGLVAVLDPDVVWMPDGGGRANAAHAAARPGASCGRVGGAQPQVRARTDRDQAQRALGLVPPSDDGHRAALKSARDAPSQRLRAVSPQSRRLSDARTRSDPDLSHPAPH
jgi:hypothetical protein